MKTAHTIEQWPVDRLVPYDRNARTHSETQVAQIAASITQFGFNNPILVDSSSGIIAGHGRLQAARKLGLVSVPVIVLDHLTDAQRRAYILADNKLALNAGWDEELLLAELRDLDEMIDLQLTGFDANELERLFATDEDDARADECPEAPETPVTRRGDLWVLGRHRVLCGDATNADDVARLMNGAKADMVFTDPPYGISLIRDDRGRVGGGTKQYPTREFARIAGDDQPFDPGFLLGYSSAMVIWGANYFADKLPPSRCWFVWDKKHPVDRTFCGCELAWTTLDRHAKVYEVAWDGWTKEGESGSKVHPSQKPVKLCADILLETTEQRGIILDLFLGSGSTLMACEKINRACYGTELSEAYCDVIVNRWQDYTGQTATLDGDGRTFAAVAEGER